MTAPGGGCRVGHSPCRPACRGQASSAPRASWLAAVAASCLLALCLLACGGAAVPDAPTIALGDEAVEVHGLSGDTLGTLARGAFTDDEWRRLLKVSVSAEAPPMLGRYAVEGTVVRFTPEFPFDAGRQYAVAFDPSAVPGAPGGLELVTASVGRPAEHTEPTTVVSRIYPTGDEIPENVLRMYVEFSGPMGRKSGVEYIHLLDDTGREIPGAVLPLDYQFWSPDHTRFTVFFDPGRVKDGILPNREMGRAFTPGRTVTLVIGRDWLDEHGLPLREEYRRTFRTGPADTDPVDPQRWQIAAPPRAGREPVRVTFGEPLDHGLLMRSLGIRRDGEVVNGEAEVVAGETEWRFTPSEPWQPGTYQLLALDILEDLAGNQVGRAFEVDTFDRVDDDPNPQTIMRPFEIR